VKDKFDVSFHFPLYISFLSKNVDRSHSFDINIKILFKRESLQYYLIFIQKKIFNKSKDVSKFFHKVDCPRKTILNYKKTLIQKMMRVNMTRNLVEFLVYERKLAFKWLIADNETCMYLANLISSI
jgi:hypothetical protein